MSKVIPSYPLAFSKEFDSSFKSSFLVELLRLVLPSGRTFQPNFFFSPFSGYLSDTLDLKEVRWLCKYCMPVYSLSSLLFFLVLMLWELMVSKRTFWVVCLFFFSSTPATLDQNYVVCELQQKVNMLYSFLRNHLKKKSIVFFASCKEVWVFSPLTLLKRLKWRYSCRCQGTREVRLWTSLQQETGGETKPHLLL